MQNRFKQWLLCRISFTSKVSTARQKFSQQINGKRKSYFCNKTEVKKRFFVGFFVAQKKN